MTSLKTIVWSRKSELERNLKLTQDFKNYRLFN